MKTTAELSPFGEWHEEVVWSLQGVCVALLAWFYYKEFFGGGLVQYEEDSDNENDGSGI